MSDFSFKIVADGTEADKSIDQVVHGLDDIRTKAARATAGITPSFRAIEKAVEQVAREAFDAAKAIHAIGLEVPKQAGHLEGLRNSLAGMTSGISKGIDAVQSLSAAWAPVNQALELGGKAIRFAEAGLDAYAKTSAEAAVQVAKLEDEFSSYKRTIMEGVGQLTVALLAPAQSFEAQYQALLKIEHSEVYKRFFKSNGELRKIDPNDFSPELVAAAARYGITIQGKQQKNAVDTLTDALGEMGSAAKEAFGANTWDVINAQSALDTIKAGMDATGRAVRAHVEQLSDYQKLLDEINGPEQQALERLNLLELAYKNGAINLETYNEQLEKTRNALIDMGSIKVPSVTSPIGAPVNDTADISTEALLRQVENVDSLTNAWKREIAENQKAFEEAQKLGAAFAPLKDAIVDMFRDGELSGEKFLDVLDDIAIKLLEMAAIQAVTGGLGGGAGGFLSGLLGGHATGAQFMVGGAGGTDQNIVAFRASRDERVTVETPEQVRSGAFSGGGVRIVNNYQDDPRAIRDSLSGRDGERVIYNTMRRTQARSRR